MEVSIHSLAGRFGGLISEIPTGVGLQTSLDLFRNGAHVLMGCRSQATFDTARATILSRLRPDEQRGKLSYLEADTSTIRTSQNAAHNVLARDDLDRLDIFIACAGRGSKVGPLNEDGVEPFMATNCLGHLAILQLLLPLMVQTSKSSLSSCRIVFVSSIAHQWSSLVWPFSYPPAFSSWEEVNDTRLSERGLYSRSKVRAQSCKECCEMLTLPEQLAQILTMKRLARDLAKENISCLAIHPGELDNRFVEKMMPPLLYPYMRSLLHWVLLNEEEGARTCLYAAASREVDQHSLQWVGSSNLPFAVLSPFPPHYSGAYIDYPARVREPSELARSRELSDRLWSLQVDLIKKQSRKKST